MVGSISTKGLVLNRRLLATQFRSFSSKTLPRQTSITADHSNVVKCTSPSPSLTMARSPLAAKPLSILPLSSIIRSLAVTSISSSRILLPPSLYLMSILAHTTSPFLSPDHNAVLRFLLKRTFYAQFCAGENKNEVQRTVQGLRELGFSGVILAYAKEVVMDETQTKSLSSCPETETAEETRKCIQNEILPWKRGTLETVTMTTPGDFVALKFTGAGSQALYALSKNLPPSLALREAIDEICHLAQERGVRLLFDAEQAALQTGIDSWTLEWMRKCNKNSDGKAVVYGTYQAYLKATPTVLAGHIAAAQADNFTLGAKLVRGAYLGSDPRHLIHDTKANTDAAYDGIAASLASRKWNQVLQPREEKEFPRVDVVLAGHNISSVRKIQAIRAEQAAKGEKQIELIYAQLQGMADEVSCELVLANKEMAKENKDVARAYKYLVWGTTGECMKYLLRRAQENKDAVGRTKSGRDAMWAELGRRVRAGVGLRA